MGGWGTAKRDFSYFSFTYEILGELEISLNIGIKRSFFFPRGAEGGTELKEKIWENHEPSDFPLKCC